MLKVAVLVSGGGSNLQALIDAEREGLFQEGCIALVVSSSSEAYALERARKAGIETLVVPRKQYAGIEAYGDAISLELERRGIGLVVLAGFMHILGGRLLSRFSGRVINVHPSLIPSFCGEGFYGLRVHRAALDYGVKVTGATVHFVNHVVDGGSIILQRAVDVLEGDTPKALQKRVMEQAEWILLPRAVAMFCNGTIPLPDSGERREQL